MSRRISKSLKAIYKKLFETFGPQRWWPAETKFEIMVGAILTQNTNWGNVEKAIKNLKKYKFLSPSKLKQIPVNKLAALIRPAGYFNIKAKRLKNFVDFLFKEYNGSIKKMSKEDIPILQGKLLGVNGIGSETADSILLYAFNKPVFVVDAYTKRIFSRHYLCENDDVYDVIQKIFTKNIEPNAELFNEYHALIVRLGKDICKSKPECKKCPLNHLKHENT